MKFAICTGKHLNMMSRWGLKKILYATCAKILFLVTLYKRDFDGILPFEQRLNLLFALPDPIGGIIQIDFALDLPDFEDDQIVGSIHNVQIRDARNLAYCNIGV